MKKTKGNFLVCAVLAAFSLSAFSCVNFSDMGLPSDVAIKSDAKYVVAMGKKYYNIKDEFGTRISDNLTNNAVADVYKYIPDPADDTLAYLMHKKLYDVPFDIGQYFDDINFDEAISDTDTGLNFSRQIVLPKIQADAELPITDESDFPFPFNVPIALVMDGIIKTATITQGEIVVQASGSGGSLDFESFSLTGITNSDDSAIEKNDFIDQPGSGYLINKRLNLAGKKIVLPVLPGGIVVQGAFSKSGTITESSIKIKVSVEKISCTANLNQAGGFTMDDSTENKKQLPAEMVNYVKKLFFYNEGDTSGNHYKSDANGNATSTQSRGVGIELNAVNSFPEGNNIALYIKSDVFGLDSTPANLAWPSDKAIKSTGNESPVLTRFVDYKPIDMTGYDSANPPYMDLSISFDENQALTDLEMGKTYSIGLSDSKLVFDWDSADMDLSSTAPVKGNINMDGFTLDQMLKDQDDKLKELAESVELVSLPVYFFVEKPSSTLLSLIGNVNLSGTLSIEPPEGGSPDYIAGSAGSSQSMPFSPTFAWPSTSEDFTKKFVEGEYSFYKDMAPILNKHYASMNIVYNIGMSDGNAARIYKATIDSLPKSEPTSITIDMAAAIPLKLNVVKDALIDGNKLFPSFSSDKKDLFSREKPSSTEEYSEYAEALDYIRFYYNLINDAVEGLKANIILDDKHSGQEDSSSYSGLYKEIEMTASDTSDDYFDFSGDEAKKILTGFFMPSVSLRLPVQQIRILRSGMESSESVGIDPLVEIKLNGKKGISIKDVLKKNDD